MKAHLLIVADGRSPTALSWIRNIQSLDYGVSLISTFPCEEPAGLLHFQILPVAFSRFGRKANSTAPTNTRVTHPSVLKRALHRMSPLFQQLRYTLGPLSLRTYKPAYLAFLDKVRPDLVHALRIPFEGMLGSFTPPGLPFITATWGNDLTLHARGSRQMRRYTRKCLQRADGLTSDTQRDVRLAHDWGLAEFAPAFVIPGSGGVDFEAIQKAEGFDPANHNLPESGTWVVNPRGLRPGSVHQEVFFKAVPKVLAKCPETAFLCPGLAGVRQAEIWAAKSEGRARIFLLPRLTQQALWSLLKKSQVFVSPSSHDGTPNTLLEAMAAGCTPVAGDIESLREWIEPGINGLLVDPRDPDALAEGILQALDSPGFQAQAAMHNLALIQTRAAQSITRPMIDDFYLHFLQ